LAAWLRTRPDAPPELAAHVLRDGILARIIEKAEAGPLGEALVEALGPESLRGHTGAGRTGAAGAIEWPDAVAGDLARAVVDRPVPPRTAIWARLQQSILNEVVSATRPMPRSLRRRRAGRVVLAATAAVLVAALFVFSRGTSRPPEIVFRDLNHAPDIDFAVLRYGNRH
jgi:hypothetical protein